ncbi:MAG: HAD hydrolase family protein, partial [Deltaproteobacteria bacterium]|nr:HAD hydrolase family protein [Deltaproteobacteria bacterium]
SVISSIDESENKAFMDILPENATKLHALRFLLNYLGIPASRAVFSGDSGNDLPVLTSEIHSVLVANAAREVRDRALREVSQNGYTDTLYLAKGIGKLNGNYCAGVLEGAAHFLPDISQWLYKAMLDI